MNRASVFEVNETGPSTYDYDESLPPLPLPDLHDTMQRYYDTLLPFATEEELKNSRQIIARFEENVGQQLQKKLKFRASSMKNWLNEWWEKYAYHCLRLPLTPYCVMASVLRLDIAGVPQTKEHAQKNLARVLYHSLEYWDLLRKSKLKPMSGSNGSIKYSSSLFKRFTSTTRKPGLDYDRIEQHFKIEQEESTPTHGFIGGKGRLFVFDVVQQNGSIISAPQILLLLQRVHSMLDYEPFGDCVPALTHDDRTTWAKNYALLCEISPENRAYVKLIESAAIVVALDENEPQDYKQAAQLSLYGDLHSRWADRSSIILAYKNGKIACIGEHSAYDGTISISFMLFIQLSMLESEEPHWNEEVQQALPIALKEIKFQLNEELKNEIKRLMKYYKYRGHDVVVSFTIIDDYGKDFLKTHKLHPDSFVQVVMQWTYARLHNEIAPTYETALMRHYYNGRTETLRSCTPLVHEFLQLFRTNTANNKQLVAAFRTAVQHHNFMMNEARKGHGIDRHLFGLWCVAHESGIDVPEFFDDPLYAKSGGGGNFVLSSSLLGYTTNVGFVAPMVLDGYGIFYSITSEAIFLHTTAFRDSHKTSAHRFEEMFHDTVGLIKRMLESVHKPNL